MKDRLQCVAITAIFLLALLADGIMATWGPNGFIKIATVILATAALIIGLPNVTVKKKTAPGAATSKSGKTSRKAD
jgi:hypothetical protein